MYTHFSVIETETNAHNYILWLRCSSENLGSWLSYTMAQLPTEIHTGIIYIIQYTQLTSSKQEEMGR